MFDNIASSDQSNNLSAAQKQPAGKEAENNDKDKKPLMPGRTVEDIFADTDKAGAALLAPKVKPAIFQPRTSPALLENYGHDDANSADKHAPKKLLLLSALIIAFIAIAGGGYLSFGLLFDTADNLPAAEPIENDVFPAGTEDDIVIPVNNDEIPVPDNTAPEGEVPQFTDTARDTENNPDIDTDQDGLTDAEEEALGTDTASADSDSDGLFDREEVRVYMTDPLNPDTDGDSYTDGGEVDKGFNPKGAGKLYDMN
ncbi:MAG: hypothetical protein V1867_03095 [Candidatus Falkowbacteria bacterium]